MKWVCRIEKKGTWEIVKKPRDAIPHGCKWVLTVKYISDGFIERYKARMVVKGFTQTYGIDYQDTFTHVAKLHTIRVLLSQAANLDWPLQLLDIKNAFLTGGLSKEVCMDLPPSRDGNRDSSARATLRKSPSWPGSGCRAKLKLEPTCVARQLWLTSLRKKERQVKDNRLLP